MMTLLVTVFAAVVSTIIWYTKKEARELKAGSLCFMYWGASLMWLVDAVFGYAEDGAEFFVPAAADMLNDLYLGLSVVALGLVVWTVIVLVKDPKGTVKEILEKRS